MEKRVVITGMGSITPIGNSVEEFWKGIKDSKCGIDKITLFDTTDHKVQLAAEVKNYDPEVLLGDKKQAKRLDRYAAFSVIAAKQALLDSGITEANTNMERVGVVVGSGIGGMETIEEQMKNLAISPDKVSPMYIPRAICNMATGNIAIAIGAKGESFSAVTACASATHSMGEAMRMIRHGYQDVVFAGGSEATVTPGSIAGFANIKALSTNTDKTRASIPFDKERDGFVMGEGSGVLVLEELEHAKKRGAKIYAEVVGYGATSDAYHITSPTPDGDGGARAMIRAYEDAKLKPEDIDYINAHGTSTPMNDACETKAIKKAFGEHAYKLHVSSTKGHTGHLLGAAGAVEAIACIKALQENFVPATIGHKVSDEECDLNIVPNKGIEKELNYVMSNSLGFGGHNCSVVLKKYNG